ncbi:pyridoxal-phosphate dependent enzyme [Xanthomonas sp. WHRI 1810A]|uniref:1-aminocyclopropane-1-carboxylate deaminase/D-cysteine desulfhydrase n=1 Tax=Xanthomonas sp. WHRI 1810A TaxID=3161565 RepID=UPI0032E91476
MLPASLSLRSAPLQPLALPWLEDAGIEVAILRLDLIDPLISGNKWFKLTHHVKAAQAAGATGLISLGGAYSNHLHALAAAGQRFGFPTVGLLRGHAHDTPTIEDLQAFGMQLHWLGYGGYRARHEPGFWWPWRARYPHLYPVPEGGGGLDGALGCAGIVRQARDQLAAVGWGDYHGWWLAAGTGTTLAGLLLAEDGTRAVYGAMAVPQGHGVSENVAAIIHTHCRSALARDIGLSATSTLTDTPPSRASALLQGCHLLEASRGGFAKTDAHLLAFIHRCEQHTGIPLEPLYTGKALLALHDEVLAGRFVKGTRLIFVHTGGLQGKRAFS